MIGLTPAQARAKRFISDYRAQHGRSPLYREIAESLGFSGTGRAHRVVCELVERGHAQFTKARARNILLVNEPASRAPDGEPLYFVPIGAAS